MQDTPTLHLVARWRQGDQQAAETLFQRYAEKLTGLTRSLLASRFSPRLDAEDVVQSAYRSFFVAARAGRYELQNGGDVWRLLVGITLHKLHHRVQYNQREKRAVERELSLQDPANLNSLGELILTHEPSPLEALALADEVAATMRELLPLQRRMLDLRLQGYNLNEIATSTRRSIRTVTRTLEYVKELLLKRNLSDTTP